MSVTLATSQLPSAWLKLLATKNMDLWEEVESSVRDSTNRTHRDEQQQRSHLVVVTSATSQFPSVWLKFVAP